MQVIIILLIIIILIIVIILEVRSITKNHKILKKIRDIIDIVVMKELDDYEFVNSLFLDDFDSYKDLI